jgi:hypothetical protein
MRPHPLAPSPISQPPNPGRGGTLLRSFLMISAIRLSQVPPLPAGARVEDGRGGQGVRS